VEIKMKKSIKNYELGIRNWVKANRLEAILIAVVLLSGAFFRIYKIDEYMTFLGDEGRDALIVRRLWTDLDFFLIGPRTSIGDMYLGPLYYYLIAPALLLANFSPAGPSVMVALIGVATIFMVWYIAREWFPTTFKGDSLKGVYSVNLPALVAAGLYAISSTVITFSKSSWNPNVMPFFSLLVVYSVWQVWKNHEWKWLVITSISFAFVLNSHYLGLLLAPVTTFFWFLSVLEARKKKSELRSFSKTPFLL
jgi:hypothetical protein